MIKFANIPIRLSVKSDVLYFTTWKQPFTRFVLTFMMIALLSSCQQGVDDDHDDKLTVAVSIPPQAWLVEQIGGEFVNIITMIQPGESPVTYQPTDIQISRVMRASAYIRIGVPFENGPWYRSLTRGGDFQVIDAREGITLRSMQHHHHENCSSSEDPFHTHHDRDPHIWLSPKLLKVQAETVTQVLCDLAPLHTESFRNNQAQLTKRIDETDAAITAILTPLTKRTFFVFHPAWGYFADAYDLEQIAIEIQGKQPTDHELTQLQQRAEELGIQVIFVQPQISSKAADAVAMAIGGRVENLDPLVPDVLENLISVAKKIADSYEPQ